MDNNLDSKTILQENELKYNKYITSRHIFGSSPLNVENYYLVRASCFLDEVELCFSKEEVVDIYLSYNNHVLHRDTTGDTFNVMPFYWHLINLAFLYSLYMPVSDHIRQKLYTALYGSSNKAIDFSELSRKHANKLEQFFKGQISLVMMNIIIPSKSMKTPIYKAIPLTALLDYILNINDCNSCGEMVINKLCSGSLYPEGFITETFYDFVLKNYVGKEKLVESVLHSEDVASSMTKKYDALMSVKEFRDSLGDEDVSAEYVLRELEALLFPDNYDSNNIEVENIDNTAISDDEEEGNDDEEEGDDDEEEGNDDEDIIDDIIVENIIDDGRFIVEEV